MSEVEDVDLSTEQSLPWHRLDWRMLLIHPVREVIRALPLLALTLLIGTASGRPSFTLLVFALVLPAAVLRYWTTQYRIGPVHVQLRRGLLRRRVLSVPLVRVRSVEVYADAMHRILGLSVMRLGTGQHETSGDASGSGFELDGLRNAAARELRTALLSAARNRAPSPEPEAPARAGAASPATELAHWSAWWVRFAPFSLMGAVTLAATVGALGPVAGRLLRASESAYLWASHTNAAEVIVSLAIVSVAASSVLAVIGYLLTYYNFRLFDTGPVLYVESGLIKRSQNSYDRARLRGASLQTPLLLRLVGGAKTIAIMTGVRSRRLIADGVLLPQAPASEARRVLHRALPDLPPDVPLRAHGPVATRRRYTRALGPVAALAVAMAAAQLAVPGWPDWSWALLVALAAANGLIALDRARSLGHSAPPGWLITRSGSLAREQDHLAADGIIGWTVRQSFFQRRTGVATVIAATPAGKGAYAVVDLPVEQTWGLIESVTPGAGDIWTEPVTSRHAA